MDSKDKRDLLYSLKTGKYATRFKPVNYVKECTKYDGTKFYLLEDLEESRSSNDMGTFTVTVEGEKKHQFIYDMNNGTWSGDELCEDEDMIDALENLKEFIDSDDYDGDSQWKIYAKANHLPLRSEYYWYEDENHPKDIHTLGDNDVEIPLQYFLSMGHKASDEKMDMECVISDQDLYDLYTYMKEQDYKFNEDTELPGHEVHKISIDLYDEIMDQIEEDASENDFNTEDQNLDFILLLPEEIFEEYL